jgi:nicotinamide phosphoribosyltransferase
MLHNIKPINFILMADSYKVAHKAEYPQDTENLYDVIVARKPSKYTDEVVAAGQTYLAEFLSTVRITYDMINEAQMEIEAMGYEFDRQAWTDIVLEHGGALPLAMYGVEEGRVVKPQTPLVGFVNTDPKHAWLVSYVETIAQSLIWKMTTVASMCRAMRISIKEYMEKSGADMTMLDYKLHNFGDRGAADPDEAVRSAIAHAMSFSGSDSMSGNRYIKALYMTSKNYLSSVEATEHSVMCSWSDPETKDDFGAAAMAVDRLDAVVERTKHGIGIPVMSVVIDTYDADRFVDKYMGVYFKDRIVNSGGKMVMRPDSGDPLVEPIKVIGMLDRNFGATPNSKGYAVLPWYVGVIQGDGINEVSLPQICQNVLGAGYSMDNILFGMGGGLTHRGQRDDFSFSMKAVARFDGFVWKNLLKEPKTDVGKKSLTGLVRCKEDTFGNLTVVTVQTAKELTKTGPGWKLWFCDGYRTNYQTFDEVRERAQA